MDFRLFAIPAALIFAIPAHAAPALAPGVALPAFDGTGNARAYAATAKSDFAKESFRAEVTVTVKSGAGGTGCAYFGMGTGKPNPASYNEPNAAPSLCFRLAPGDFAGGLVLATVNGGSVAETPLGDGVHRLRLTWNGIGKPARLQIHKHWKPGSVFKPDTVVTVPDCDPKFDGKESRLFVGGAGGVAFGDFAVVPLSREEAEAIEKLPVPDAFPRDASADTWLPVAGVSDGAPQAGTTDAADKFLATVGARLRPVVCWYKNANLDATRAFRNGELTLPHSRWTSEVTFAPDATDPGAAALSVTTTLKEGVAYSAGVATAFDFTGWSTDNYVMVPCSVYNGNRNRIVGGGYAQGQPSQDWYKKGLPLTTREIPRLALDPKEKSRFEVNTSNTGTPCVAVLQRKTGKGFILLAEQGGRGADGDFIRKTNGEIRDNAFIVEESDDRTRASVVVSAPGVRDKFPMFVGFAGSPDRGITIHAGDRITQKFRVYAFDAKDMAGFYDKFMAVRKALTGPNHPRNLHPMSEVATMMAARIDSRWYEGKAGAFYCPENAAWISFGWIGGLMDTHPMLALGDDKHFGRVSKTFDFAIPAAQGEAGYFYGAQNADGKPFGREGYADPKVVLVRKNADVLYWMMKQFMLMKTQGRPIKPAWESNIRRLADAFVKTWRKDGEWGNYVNVDTGEVVIYNSTSSAQASGGLALASVWYGNPEYLAVAKEAAGFYYKRDFLGWGATTGHSADTLQNADGDSPMAFASSLATLAEITGDATWMEKARHVLGLQASWTTSFDYELPKTTELGRLDAKLAGVIWASTQNKHAAPGHCTSASDPLLRVYRATGDERCAELLRDIWHAHGESIRPGGLTNERLTYCDADSRGDRGSHVTGWNETNGLMMATELPGIYLRTDTDRFYVFDSVEAKVLSRTAQGVKLEITNPTKADAKVAVFAENAAEAQKPLGQVAFLKWPKVEVKAGGTATVTLAPDGAVK